MNGLDLNLGWPFEKMSRTKTKTHEIKIQENVRKIRKKSQRPVFSIFLSKNILIQQGNMEYNRNLWMNNISCSH